MDDLYIISPVAADPDFAAKRSILARNAGTLGLKALFPLDRDPSIALEKASDDIRTASFVLADLSYERPSCYFELGLAEAAGADVGIIAKAGTPIHQVGYASQVNFYRDLDDYDRVVGRLLEAKFAAGAARGPHNRN
jgi:hypothetical protein